MKSRAFIHVAAVSLAASAALPAVAAAQSSPRFDDVRLSTGIRLRYAEQGGGPGEPIILLHGLSDSWFSFSRVLPLLSAQRTVYALDQRGHGDSDKPTSGYAMRDLAADVIAFMDAKRIDRATVLGHSMGSFVAQQVALAAPQRVSKLILVGSTTAPRMIAGMADLDSIIRTMKDKVPTEFLREFIDRAVQESTKLPAYAWRGLLDGLLAADPPVALGTSGIPTLLVWGEQDTYAVASEQSALVALVRTATLKAYPNTGHAPHWERPATFAQDVNDFISRKRAN
jgi:non-heme chloroperoxidase